MQPKVYIVIVAFHHWSDTLACLTSLEKINYANYRIVLVNNGSDQPPKTLSQKIILINNPHNLGFAGGNNEGIKYAQEHHADYILFLNNDTIVSSDFLQILIEAAQSNENYAMVGPKIYSYQNKQKIWYAGGKISWLMNKGTMRGYDEIDQGQYDLPPYQSTDYISGCCLLVRTKLLDKIGLMPEDYFLYYEDTDWSLRVKKQGFKCIFVPAAVIWHKGSKSTREGSSSYIYYHARNGLMLANKYAPFYKKIILHLDVIWRLIKQGLKFVFLPSKRIWAKNIFLGIKDFYLNKTGK